MSSHSDSREDSASTEIKGFEFNGKIYPTYNEMVSAKRQRNALFLQQKMLEISAQDDMGRAPKKKGHNNCDKAASSTLPLVRRNPRRSAASSIASYHEKDGSSISSQSSASFSVESAASDCDEGPQMTLKNVSGKSKRLKRKLCAISKSSQASDRKRKSSSYYKGTKLQDSKYRVYIFDKKKEYNLGRYMLESDAAHAYDEAAKLVKSSAWKLNFESIDEYIEARANEINIRDIDESDVDSCDAIDKQIKARMETVFPELVNNTGGQKPGEEQGIYMENTLDYNEMTSPTDISKKRKASTNEDSSAVASSKQTSHGLSNRKRKTSSYKGTKLQDSKYRAYIFDKKKEYNLGRYMLESDAAHVYDEAAKLLKAPSWRRNFKSRNAYLKARANEIKQREIDEEEFLSSDAIGMQIKAQLKNLFPKLGSNDNYSIDSDSVQADEEHTSDWGDSEAEQANKSCDKNVFGRDHIEASEHDCSSGRLSSLHPQSIKRRKNRPAAVPRPRNPFDASREYSAKIAVQHKRLGGLESDDLLPMLDVREMAALLEHIVLEGLLARNRDNDLREFCARSTLIDSSSNPDRVSGLNDAEDSKIYAAALNKGNACKESHFNYASKIGSDTDDELIPKEYLLSNTSAAKQNRSAGIKSEEIDRVWIEEYGDGIDPRMFADEYISSRNGKDGKYTSLLVQSCWDRAVHEVSSTIPVNLNTKKQDENDTKNEKFTKEIDSQASLHNRRMSVASALHANAMDIVNSVIDLLFSEHSSLTQIMNDESRCKRVQWHDVCKLLQESVSANNSNIPSFNEVTMNAISMRLIERYGIKRSAYI